MLFDIAFQKELRNIPSHLRVEINDNQNSSTQKYIKGYQSDKDHPEPNNGISMRLQHNIPS